MKLSGQVVRVRRRIDDWVVVDFLTSRGRATIAGLLCGLRGLVPGVRLTWLAERKDHPKYGVQYVPYGWEPPTEAAQIELFLHECVEGFEVWSVVQMLTGAFGDRTLEVMSSDPAQVVALAKDEVTQDTLRRALLSWDQVRGRNSLSLFLHDFQVAPWLVEVIARHLGAQSLEILKTNPYRLAGMPLGADFAQIDQLALKIGFHLDDPLRLQGGILWVLRHMAPLDGHVFLPREAIVQYLDVLMRQGVEPFALATAAIEEALQGLVTQQDVTIEGDAVYLPDFYRFEVGAAEMLTRVMAQPHALDVDLPAFLAEYERGTQITLSETQREGLLKLLGHRALVITGLPGTGKTSLVRAIVQLFHRAGIKFVLVAPTGIAAKRLSAVTYTEAATIHRQFQCDLTGKWGYGGSVKYPVEAVIVDEVSMVDQQLIYRVLDAVGDGTMLVLVGDDAQLPSVGPGNVLRELLSCPEVPHVRLTQIFRQSRTSEIVEASHAINQGTLPDLAQATKGEFRFVPVGSEETLRDLVVQMAVRLKAKDASFQVLSPKYDGTVGVNALNEALREALNPDDSLKKMWIDGQFNVRQGDRVMVVQNDYKLGVYNGDLGKLVSIQGDSLVVRIHGYRPTDPGLEVSVPKEQAAELLRLAYAVTVHKIQGSEFDTVILPMVRTHGRMLQRNLFYTAITRARKQVWVLGDPMACQAAVANAKVALRYTSLGAAITQKVEHGRQHGPDS